MRITESRLRGIIRQVIKENYSDENYNKKFDEDLIVVSLSTRINVLREWHSQSLTGQKSYQVGFTQGLSKEEARSKVIQLIKRQGIESFTYNNREFLPEQVADCLINDTSNRNFRNSEGVLHDEVYYKYELQMRDVKVNRSSSY